MNGSDGGRKSKNNAIDIFTEVVMAGKRKYYIDVKKLKDNLYYLVITESVKSLNPKEESPDFKKYRIVLFPEDFGKFVTGINNAIKFIKNELMPGFDFDKFNKNNITLRKDDDSESDSSKSDDYSSLLGDITV